MLTYDQMLDISLKINRKELFLEESVYQKLNAIKKQLNIHSHIELVAVPTFFTQIFYFHCKMNQQ